MEVTLSKEALQLLLVDQLKIAEPEQFKNLLLTERYSTLVRSLALLIALNNLVTKRNLTGVHQSIREFLARQKPGSKTFVELRTSRHWDQLLESYKLSSNILYILNSLATLIKELGVKNSSQLTFKDFRGWWIDKKLNRLEYYTSALERIVDSAELLPRAEDSLPSVFSNCVASIREAVRAMSVEARSQIDLVNRRFQELVEAKYPEWLTKDQNVGIDSPCLTSQFIAHCLKRYWDPKTEKAIVLLFDGMRYDIWEELLKPLVERKWISLPIFRDLGLPCPLKLGFHAGRSQPVRPLTNSCNLTGLKMFISVKRCDGNLE